jgi:PAS domain S-box-containing protein
MRTVLQRILTPPVFDDEEKTRHAFLLHTLLWTLIVIPLPYLAYVIVFLPELFHRALTQVVIAEIVNVALYILLRRGYVKLTAVMQVASLWLFFTVTAATGAGIKSEAYLLGYVLVIAVAGFLLGGKGATAATVLSLAAGGVMAFAEARGWLIPKYVSAPYTVWVVSLMLFPVGAVLQYLSSRTIRSALKRARLSEEKYRLISSVSTDYTFESVVDEEGNARAVWVGGAFEKMTGYNFEEYTATGGWYGHIHPDDLEKDAEDMRKLLHNQEVIGSEIRTFAKDGTIRWERVFAHPVWDEAENRLVGIIGAVQDITEQKQAEHMLKETLLRQNAILDNIPDIAWLKDRDSRYIAVNEQFAKACGLKIEEIIGKTDHAIWQRQYADHYRRHDLKVIQSGEREYLEETLLDHTGREHWVETIKTPIRNALGEVTGTIGIAREITERKKAEFERERLIAELEAKNAELEQFTYTVSHDLKSPLVTITGFINYLERDIREGNYAQFQADVERIRSAADKMRTLLNDLLELSRIGRIMNEPEWVGFGEIVREALSLVEGQIQARGVSVEFADEGRRMYGDRTRLVEVMQNLLDNAVKFMGGQPHPRIRVGTMTDAANQTVYFVQDNGIGVDPKFQDRIFGLFNKLDANSEGSGVGLTIVKRVVEVHGGSIWFESQPGEGSTFFFTLSQPESSQP